MINAELLPSIHMIQDRKKEHNRKKHVSGEWRAHCNDCWTLNLGPNVKLVEQRRPALYIYHNDNFPRH